jgi:SAM-dependent methyltransferase
MATDHDSGGALRDLYQGEGGVRAIFSQKVSDYRASRPNYPSGLFELLKLRCPPLAGTTVADVGAGTGLLTGDLLKCGYRVIAVEPNAEMRAAADILLGGVSGYRSVDASAESMPLETGSVDLITVAQAFHWFETEKARVEFLRVLTPRGQVALIWNDRVLEDPLHVGLDEIFAEFGGDRRTAVVDYDGRANVPRFFGSAQPEEFSWPHEHRLGEEGLLSLVLSRSYMPRRAADESDKVAERVRQLFARFAVEGAVRVRYRAALYLGRPG